MTQLASRSCTPQRGNKLDRAAASKLLIELSGWSMDEGATLIRRTFKFKNYFQTMAFVNAVAWIAHREDHHPDMTVGYNTVSVMYATHSVGGLSENDFVCAAKVDALGSL
jgi:4a-hydroxytetrahydrobiopterin dehydratase